MRRFTLLAAAAFLIMAASVSACINDRESIKSEKEFKSRYNDAQPAAPQYPKEENRNLVWYLTGGSGVALLAGAFLVNRMKFSKS